MNTSTEATHPAAQLKPAARTRQPFYKAMYFQVLLGIVLGGLVGHFWPDFAASLKPLGDAFIKLIKMIIGPVVFCTVVTGIAGMQDLKKVGRVGGKALLYFEIISTVSLVIGLFGGHLFNPGAGFHVNPDSLDASAVTGFAEKAQHLGIVEFLMSIIPNTFVSALADGNILCILLISVLFGCALSAMGDKGKPVYTMIEGVSGVFFGIVHIIAKFSAVGAFGAIAFTVGTYGAASLLPLLKLIASFYVLCIFFIVLVLGFVARLCGFSILRFVSYIKDELLIVLGTSSSEVVLPQIMEKMERLGCSKSVVGLVIPTGYSFNLDGTNIYLTMAVLFIAQALDIELTWGQQLTLIIVAMLSSKGASGVSGAAFVMLTSTLLVVPVVPVAGMVLILGIHRFMGTGLAMTNLVGNGVAALVVSAWEKELDRGKLNQQLHSTKH
ncbi:dicarboxylate/amino acid:cation symporter [Pseudomonas sp. GD03746]|uniref:dicarboxylate/amino acid:cation symporter n=1 Tax=Pseudomonas sp. GD03746 TaxID=2975378 RepID=UPI00244CDCE7|nr:dicarboxylate/amino acid:cation symporter [Pseudomonas sp. GD03746]MDH1576496.1 dicarboxylate/amino acid:cation symporter [Pseudomonas sp. GD03746]